MREFTTVADGYEAEMSVGERAALAQVAAEVVMLLESHPTVLDPTSQAQDATMPRFSSANLPTPTDPVLRRLLPDAAPTEPDVDVEFRRLTEQDLVASKVQRLTVLVDRLVEELRLLDPEAVTERDADRSFELLVRFDEASDFAAALTDVRLALGVRLGIQTDIDSDQLHDNVLAGWEGEQVLADDAQYLGTVMLLAGFLQESLLTQMLDDVRSKRGQDEAGEPADG